MKRNVLINTLVIFSLLILLTLFSLAVTASHLNSPIEEYRPFIHSAFVPDHPRLITSGTSEVLLFTGSERYYYPIELPPGTNGLEPTFAISYNSNKVSNKPSFVGSGWEITENYIQTNINYTLNNVTDDKYELIFNGLKYDLLYIPSENRWHTQDETFFSIENKTGASNGDGSGRYWIVKTKYGTMYQFGFNTDSTMIHNKNSNIVWRWSLDLINDTHENKVTYSYREDPFTADASAVYPYKITYNNDNKRTVNFVYETSTRPDLWMTFENGARVNESRRLKEIFTTAENRLVKRYVIEYVLINNSMRTGITNITIYGSDNSTTLPPVKFKYNDFIEGWSSNTTWDIPASMHFMRSDNNDTGTRFINLNGDGFMDLIRAENGGTHERWLNNGNGWSNSSMWTTVGFLNIVESTGEDEGARIDDINNDGFDDIIRAEGVARTNIINNGTDWEQNVTWNLPGGFGFVETASGKDLGTRLIDINGDSWPDLVKTTTTEQQAFLNNGTTTPDRIWRNVSAQWKMPSEAAFIIATTGDDLGVRMVDVNRDGLPDILKGEGTTIKTWLNDGNGGWPRDSRWDIPSAATFVNTTYDDQGVRIADINGDGLPDLIKGYGTTRQTWINNGAGWTENATWALPNNNVVFVDTTFKSTGVRIADVNGDELPDIVKQNYTDTLTYLNNAAKGYLLKNTTFDYGGTEAFTYRSSSVFNESGNYSRAYLNFNLWVVSNVTRDNNMSGATRQNYNRLYNYSRGYYDARAGEFRGFGYVEERINDTLVKHYFHQDDARTGQEYITSTHKVTGTTFQNVTQDWRVTNQNGINTTQLASSVTETYDGTANNRKINLSYSYDVFGNNVEINNSGDMNINGDETYQVVGYINNSAKWIVDKVINETLYGFTATNKVRQTFYQYDNQSYGVAPTKGDLTLKEDWLNGGTNPTTRYDYDSYGNVVLENDTNSHERRYIFGLNDTTYTFANKVKTPVNHTEGFVYDLGTGNLLQRNDSNSITTNYTYDALGRSQKEIMPFDDSTYPTSQYEYSIDGTAPEKVKVSKREISGTSNTHDLYYFYDGYGNLIQIKEDSENNQQIVLDIFYDAYDRVKAISNQYYTTFSTEYTSPDLSIATINYTYDPINRVVNITNPDQSQIEIIFNRWNVTVYDENDNRMDYANDAYGRIITVKEYNDSIIFYTNYTYNAAGDLIKINDTYGNTFNSTYDTLGRKTQMQDPDLGTWNYTYDGVGNVLLESGSRGNKIQYTYDSADRLKRKNATDTFVNYTYDLRYNGTVAMIVLNGTIINYTYDNRLRKIADTELINARIYINNYSYDAANRLTQQILPTGKVINYTYTEDNLLKTVSNLSTFVVNMTYNQFKLPTARKYNNTKITNITYNQTNARVTQINTTGLQELRYNYDAVGNVLKINDTTHWLVTTMQYDDLNRLIYVEQKVNGSLNESYNYSYDAIGNLKAVNMLSDDLVLIYNASVLHAPGYSNSSLNTSGVTLGNKTSDLNGTFIYALNTNFLLYRLWNLSVGELGEEINSSVNVGGRITQYLIAKSNPKRDEIILATVDVGDDTNLQIINSTNGFTNLLEVTSTGGDQGGNVAVGIEEVSGDVLIVYENTSNNDNLIAYRIWNGTSYSSPLGVTLNITGWITSLDLYEKQNTDQMMLVAANGSGTIWSILWNGTQFDPSTNTTSLLGPQSFTLSTHVIFAWESLSGDGILAYARTGTNDTVSRNYTDVTKVWSDPEIVKLPHNAVYRQIQSCSDPTSDYIGFIFHSKVSSGNFSVLMWNGTQYLPSPPNTTRSTTASNNAYVKNIDCIWSRNGTIAKFGYPVDANETIMIVNFTKPNSWSVSSLNNGEETFDFGRSSSTSSDFSLMRFFGNKRNDEFIVGAVNNMGPNNFTMIRWNGTAFVNISAFITGDVSNDLAIFVWNGYLNSNTPPTQDTPILNSTFGTNLTTENLTVYNISTFDANNESVEHIVSWYRNNTPYLVLNVNFGGDSNGSITKEFSGRGYILNGTGNAVYESTASPGGTGLMNFTASSTLTKRRFYVTNGTSLNVDNDSFSIEAFISAHHRSTAPTDSYIFVSTLSNGSGNVGISLTTRDVANTIRFRMGNATNTSILETGPNINDNGFHHIVAVFDRVNGRAYMYVDNILKGNSTFSTKDKLNTGNISIGGHTLTSINAEFNGTISYVRVWNGTLSSEQVNLLFRNVTNIIDAHQTEINDTWNASITPDDQTNVGITKFSNNLTIVG